MEDSFQSVTIDTSIYLSSYTNDSSHFNCVRDKFMKNLEKDVPFVKEAVKNCTSDFDRIKMFQKYFDWDPIPQNFLVRLQKSVSSSTHFREMGNTDYAKDQLPSALRSYNLALCFAQPNSVEESLAYSNRSGLLVRINEFGLALEDITRTNMKLLTQSVVDELMERRNKCEESLKNGNSNEEQKKKSEQGVNFCKNKVLKNPNKFLIGAEDCIKMDFNTDSQRRLLATEDIPGGTVLLKDKPFAVVLDKALLWDTEHCSTCTRPILVGIPDPNSTFPMYCSITCLSKTKSLPNPLLTYLHLCPYLRDTLLPLVIIFEMPDKNAIPSPHVQVYDPTKYDTVYKLIQHREQYDFSTFNTKNQNLPPIEFKALFLSHLVTSLCPELNIDLEFFASHLLRHMESLPYNQITLTTWYSVGIGPYSHPYFASLARQAQTPISNVPYASAIFNLVALVNNSCDPNAVFFKNCRTDSALLISTRGISKGQEITMSYKGHWSKIGVEERRRYLKKEYCFDCSCSACQDGLDGDELLDDVSVSGNLGEEDELLLELLESQLQRSMEFIAEEFYMEAFHVIVKCCDALSKFDTRYQMSVVAQDLLRRVVVQLAML